MKKLLKVSMVALMAAATLTGCSSGDSGSSKECKVKIGFVTDVGGIDDRSFNQSSWEGLEAFAKENSIDASCVTYVESKAEADYVTNLSSMADKGNDLVVAAGFLFTEAMDEVSKNYPDTKFFVIDTVVNEPNVVSGVFAAEQSSYLAGVAAAMQAKAEGGNAVGFIGGMESDIIKAFQAGFEQGALSVDPEMKVYVDYAKSFDDTAGGQTAAQKQYNAGVKVIYHAAGNTGNGVIKEAQERVAKGDKVWVVGVDTDQFETGKMDDGKSVILTSALKRVDNATNQIAKSVLDGKFEGGKTIAFSIKDGGVGFPTENPNLTDDIVKALEKASEDIKNGTITVSAEAKIANGSSN